MRENIIKCITRNKNNKFYIFCKLVLSLFYTITMVLDKMFVFNGSAFGNLSENYFVNFEIKHVLMAIGIFIFTYFIISIIELIVDKIDNKIYTKNRRKEKNIKI